MSTEKPKSMGSKVLGSCGIFISIASLGILIFMNIKYKELLTARYNISFAFYILVVFISSIGIILLKAWARILLIIILSVKIIESIIKSINYAINSSPQMKSLHFLEQFINISIFLLIIYFLSRKSIKSQFR
jgi:hypothetical protein